MLDGSAVAAVTYILNLCLDANELTHSQVASGVRGCSDIKIGRKFFCNFIYILPLANSGSGYRHCKWKFNDVRSFLKIVSEP